MAFVPRKYPSPIFKPLANQKTTEKRYLKKVETVRSGGYEPRGKCLHSPTYPPVREVLATAKAAGAVVVFAHPTVYKSMPLLRELVAEGAIDGIEVHHPRNSPEDRAECAELCKKHDLIVTGGSDFHGANHGKPHPVGACVTEDDQIARIEALARKRRGGAL